MKTVVSAAFQQYLPSRPANTHRERGFKSPRLHQLRHLRSPPSAGFAASGHWNVAESCCGLMYDCLRISNFSATFQNAYRTKRNGFMNKVLASAIALVVFCVIGSVVVSLFKKSVDRDRALSEYVGPINCTEAASQSPKNTVEPLAMTPPFATGKTAWQCRDGKIYWK